MPQDSNMPDMNKGSMPIEKRGWVPQKVQGGYVPKARAGAVLPLSPPKGGSAIKSPSTAKG
jgi:hypothetical protein